LTGAETLNKVDLTFIVPVSGPGGGGGTGGGGGGGVVSGENASNIDVRECYDLEIFKDSLTSYTYTHPLNPIRFINITGNINGGVITSCAEVLKDTSSLVTSDAPGVVYKNVNIWVGLKGFATPNNIKDANIVFKVNNSWLTNNNVAKSQLKLLKWDGSKWITLDTRDAGTDGINTYFESGTNSFSSFAISGITEITATATPSVTKTPTPGITGTATPPVKAPTIQNWILVVIIAAAYFCIIKKK
jgi:PGF-pre-PGF domain-containing protein